MLDWLWYLDWNDTFIVPVVHALLHNVFGKFLTFALRQVAADTDAATVISREARKTLAARVDEVIPTADIGRTVKCPLKHLGLYTFEDFKNLALVYGNYLFADILPPTLEAMYNNLVTATQHYLTFGNFTAASRRAARDALLEYARAAERLGPVAACLLTPSLHILVCR
ncbi:MAG: hypothetical protein J3K34DRAFT_366483 [Monoraphidium minutum]|nr:MAG: hypothetical protein J3K34DRAFT_372598 [Monoraphidium minutum]KAI8474014.1 MAG: hypothetical protein J3K34DRAFT_366483 [Monoraphidium minutum]